MADYQLQANEMVLRTGDGAWIPNDPNNRDRIEYDAWVAKGGVPDPYVEPPQPPTPEAANANDRLDAGIEAAVDTVTMARDAIRAIPNGGAVPPRLDALLLQLKVTMDAFVAMLQAQAAK